MGRSVCSNHAAHYDVGRDVYACRCRLSESPIPFEEAEEVAPTLSLEEDLSSATRLSTLKNIRALKTYCITAKRKAVSLQDGVDSNKKGPIVDFIVNFGTPVSAKRNIVNEYAKVMGRLKRTMKKGLHAYVMKNFDRAVIFGKGVVKLANSDGAGMYAFLDHKSGAQLSAGLLQAAQGEVRRLHRHHEERALRLAEG